MNAHIAPRLEPLDAWVLSTYLRLECLRVPAFAHLTAERRLERLFATAPAPHEPPRVLPRRVTGTELSMLPTDLPRDLQDADSLSPMQRLSLLFRYLSSPLRYEPGTESAMHKAVPSSRGMFPLSYVLLQRRGGSVVANEYVPQHHALRAVACDPEALSEGAGAALVCVARVWRVAEIYGEFAHFPCALEAGHAHAQLNHLAAALDLRTDAAVDREAGRSLCRRDFEVPLFAVALKIEAHGNTLPRQRARLGELQGSDDLARRFPRLPQMQRLFDTGCGSANRRDDLGGRRRSVTAPARTALLAAMRARSAGNDRGGIAARLPQLPDGLSTQLIDAWNALRGARLGLECEAELRLSLAWLAGGGTPVGICTVDGHKIPAQSPAVFKRSLAAMLPLPDLRLNLSTLVAIGILEVDPLSALARAGDSALRDMHLAAGAVAQDLSLAAATFGLFARPVRMMREAPLEAALKLRGQVIYLVLLGVARRSRFSVGLL